jgi:hypothetical protein
MISSGVMSKVFSTSFSPDSQSGQKSTVEPSATICSNSKPKAMSLWLTGGDFAAFGDDIVKVMVMKDCTAERFRQKATAGQCVADADVAEVIFRLLMGDLARNAINVVSRWRLVWGLLWHERLQIFGWRY